MNIACDCCYADNNIPDDNKNPFPKCEKCGWPMDLPNRMSYTLLLEQEGDVKSKNSAKVNRR
jgi:hypothetical protein